MNKFLILIVAILFSFAGYSQNPVFINQPYDFRSWVNVKDALQFPTGCGVPSGTVSLNGANRKKAAIYQDSCGKKTYIYNPSDSTWSVIGDPRTWCSIDATKGNGTIDVSADINAMILAGCKYIYIPSGTFLLNNTIQLKDSVTIAGNGATSLFKLTKNQPGFKCGWAAGGSKTTFLNFSFTGSYSDSTLQDGIFADSCNAIIISNIRGYKLAGAGIRMRATGFCCAMYTMNAVRGNIISDSYFDSCQVGVKIDTVAEFITVANTTCTNGGIGIFTAAGSSNISSCRLGMNNYGLYVTGGSNNAHGTCENTHMPHNKMYGVYVTGATNGYRFLGNMIRQNPTADVYIENSTNIMFEHNDIGAVAITVINSTGTKFIDNLYWGPPTWNITGTAPTVIQNGETLNTLSIKDVVNNKSFNIAHSNGLVDLSGATRVRMANDTLNFSTSGTQHYISGGENANDSVIITSTTNITKGKIKFGTQSTGITFLESNGNFGLGTTNPTNKLDLRGSGILNINIQPDAGGHSRMTFNTTPSDPNTGAQFLFGDALSPFTPGGLLVSSISNFLALGCTNGDIRFLKTTTVNGTNEHARYTNNGSYLFGTTTNDPSKGRFQLHSRVRIDSTLHLQNVVAETGSYNLLTHNLSDSSTNQLPAATVITGAGGVLILKGSTTWQPGTVAAGSSATTTTTVTGAVLGDPVTISKASGAYSNGELYDAFVSAADTVTIRVHNVSTGSANYNTTETYKVIVLKY